MGEEMGKRRSYTPEYRVEAAGMVLDTGRPAAVVARELGLCEQTLSRWVRKEKQRRGMGVGSRSVEELEADNERLNRENVELRKDNEFLKKAASFFAANHQHKNASV